MNLTNGELVGIGLWGIWIVIALYVLWDVWRHRTK
jgi:hypothetical protein